MREDPQIRLRVPVWLKDKLHQAAENSGRSVNSEISLRLQASFMGDVGLELLPSADFAAFLADQAKVNGFNDAVRTVIQEAVAPAIRKAIYRGEKTFTVETESIVYYYRDNHGFMPIPLLDEVVKTLNKAGYETVLDSTEITGKF